MIIEYATMLLPDVSCFLDVFLDGVKVSRKLVGSEEIEL
jgi:hypothetical protein